MARDVNDVLMQDGPDAVRRLNDEAKIFHGPRYTRSVNGSEKGWPQPDMTILTRRGKGAAPVLDLNLLGPLGEIVEVIAEYKGAPVDAAALALLTSASALIGAKRRARPWSGWPEPTILWGGLVMPPSQNKSPILDPYRDALQAAERSLLAGYDEKRRKFEGAKIAADAARAKWEKDVKEAMDKGYATPPLPAAADPPEEPVKPRFWIGDITMEKAARLMAAQPGGLLVYRDELAGWISGFGRYSGSSGDRHFWKEAFGGRPLRFDRVNAGEVDIPFAAASVIGAIPPDSVNSLILSSERDGLSARFDWVWPEPVRPRRPRGSEYEAVQEQLNRIFQRLSTLAMDRDHLNKPVPRDLPLEDESANAFEAWRIQHFVEVSGAAGLYADALGKQPGKLLRFASILEHLWWATSSRNEEPTIITAEAARNATIMIDQWATPHLQRVLGEAAIPKSDHGAAILAKWLLKERPPNFNASSVRRNESLPGLSKAREMDEACAELMNASWVRLIGATTAKGGAPKKDYLVNPLIYRQEGY